MKTMPIVIAVVLIAGLATGQMALEACIPAAVVGPVTDLGACVAGVEQGEPVTASVEKRIADAFFACGGDVLAIIDLLTKSHAGDPAFLAALDVARSEYTAHPAAFRMKLAAHVADGGTTVTVTKTDGGAK